MRAIKLDENNIVISTRSNALKLAEGEIYSNLGKINQKMLEDGSFVDIEYNVNLEPKQPSNSEIAQMINDLKIELILSGVI